MTIPMHGAPYQERNPGAHHNQLSNGQLRDWLNDQVVKVHNQTYIKTPVRN